MVVRRACRSGPAPAAAAGGAGGRGEAHSRGGAGGDAGAAGGSEHGGAAAARALKKPQGGHKVVSLNPSEMFTHLQQFKQVRRSLTLPCSSSGRGSGAGTLVCAAALVTARGSKGKRERVVCARRLSPWCVCRPAQVSMETLLGHKDARSVPPEVLQLGLRYADGTITGASARCLALLNVLAQVRPGQGEGRGRVESGLTRWPGG